jgi:hypothetical protein
MRSAGLRCLAILLAANPGGVRAQDHAPIPAFLPPIEFHFSDPARDAEYWRLEREVDRSMAVAREALYRARVALKLPAPEPGTAAWSEARAAVERAIRADIPARQTQMALIAFARVEGPKLSPGEARAALQTRQVHEESLLAATDNLVDLLVGLAGIKIGQWPP